MLLTRLMIEFKEFIKSIPNVVWSGIVASFVTLIGVGLTIRHNSKQRERDRALDLKREVYLEAISSISKGIHRIANIWSVNIGDHNSRQTNGMEQEISSSLKILIVSSNETFQKASDLINLMNQKFVNLYLKSANIYFIEQKFKIETNCLTDEFEKLLKQVTLETQKYQKKIELLTEIANAVEEVNQKALHLIISIRKELNLSVDEKFILEVARKNNEVSKNLIKKSQAEMAKEIKDLLEFTSKVSKQYLHPEQKAIAKEDGFNSVEYQNGSHGEQAD